MFNDSFILIVSTSQLGMKFRQPELNLKLNLLNVFFVTTQKPIFAFRHAQIESSNVSPYFPFKRTKPEDYLPKETRSANKVLKRNQNSNYNSQKTLRRMCFFGPRNGFTKLHAITAGTNLAFSDISCVKAIG